MLYVKYLSFLLQLQCRPPLVKSMSRSSITAQAQVYSTADEEDDRAQSSLITQPRRDSESE